MLLASAPVNRQKNSQPHHLAGVGLALGKALSTELQVVAPKRSGACSRVMAYINLRGFTSLHYTIHIEHFARVMFYKMHADAVEVAQWQ